MHPLSPDNPIFSSVLRDFRRWSKDRLPRDPGMVGQTETHFPCKSAYAVAVYDHEQERFTYIRVMMGFDDWKVINL